MRFANDFHSWLRHSWKSLANRLTRDPKIVIHGNSCIILYICMHVICVRETNTHAGHKTHRNMWKCEVAVSRQSYIHFNTITLINGMESIHSIPMSFGKWPLFIKEMSKKILVGHLVVCSLTMKHTRVVSLNARQAKPGVHLVDTTRVCFIVNEHTTKCSCFYHTC